MNYHVWGLLIPALLTIAIVGPTEAQLLARFWRLFTAWNNQCDLTEPGPDENEAFLEENERQLYLNTVTVRCAMCLAITKTINDSFTRDHFHYTGRPELFKPKEFTCEDNFERFIVRRVGAVRFIGPPAKRGVVTYSPVNGHWEEKLIEMCKYLKLFYPTKMLFEMWKGEGVIEFVCFKSELGFLPGECRNIIDIESIPKHCRPRDHLCLHRWIKWNKEFLTVIPDDKENEGNETTNVLTEVQSV